MFQMIDLDGVKIPEAPEIQLDREKILSIYRVMARLQAFDDVFYNAQVTYLFSLTLSLSRTHTLSLVFRHCYFLLASRKNLILHATCG